VPGALPFSVRKASPVCTANNRTLLLLLSPRLGTFLMVSLYLVQKKSADGTHFVRGKNHQRRLFDIQPSQETASHH